MNVIQPIWKTFRNISYVFFVLILVFIGFAIMFRVKISPQAVITIQSALPKIILALILITFSYAIVGLLIDLSFVITLLIGGAFREILLNRIAELLSVSREALQILEAFLFGTEPITQMTRTVQAYVFGTLGPTIAGILLFVLIGALAGGILTSPTGPGAVFGAALGSIIFAVLIAIILLWILIRCLWTLFNAFIQVILALIFAPFQILIGVLPGSNAVGSWFRNLIANLAVFPAMITMFFLASYFSFEWTVRIIQSVAGVAGKDSLTLLVDVVKILFSDFLLLEWTAQALSIIVLPFLSLGILWMAPKVSDMIKSYLAGKPFEYGTGIGQAVGPMVTGVGVPFVAQKMYEREWGRFEPVRRVLLRTGEAARKITPPETE